MFCRFLTRHRFFYAFFACLFLFAAALLHACAGQDDPETAKESAEEKKDSVKLVYADWVSGKKFYWSPSDMEEVMLMAKSRGISYGEAAENWMKEKRDTVDTWAE